MKFRQIISAICAIAVSVTFIGGEHDVICYQNSKCS